MHYVPRDNQSASKVAQEHRYALQEGHRRERNVLLYPAITSVKISFEGQPNHVYIYTQQFKKHDFFDDACRVFFPAHDLSDRNVNQLALYKDKFALVIDFSTQV